ncbi:MAG TPA: hypothetical protein VIW69_09945 [Candidatus Elarobacter sp.]
MNRLLRKKNFFSVLASLAAVSLAACGGGGSHSSALPASAPISNAPAAPYNGPLADATFKITIPGPKSGSSKSRKPSYVSSATKSIRFSINSSTLISGATLTAYNARPQNHFDTGTLPNATCPVSGVNPGDFICTFKIQLPPGSDQVVVTLYDNTGGAGNVLSQQTQNLTVVAGAANSFSMTLDANAATIALSGTQPCTSGSIQGVFGSANGTSPVTINVSFTDAATKTIVAPGMPIISIRDNDTTFHTTSGTITGTGGSAAFSINQATQSFTLTPSAIPLSNVTVIVHGTQADTNVSPADGLSFTQSHTFTFSAASAPPTSQFLGVIEQSGAPNTGQINFYTVSLGGVGGPDSISAWTTPTLATTNSISTPSQPDVNNPLDMIWDTGGNLLISNGGQGGAVTGYAPSGDFGNFACVPAGAISTGANLATTDSTNLHVPAAIALSSNGTVALANNPGNSATKVEEFTLSTNYVPGSSLPDPGGNTFGVPLGRPLVNLPTLTAGTFGVGLYNGTNSKIDILGPTGTVGTLTDGSDSELHNPFGMAWDPTNNQLVVANQSGCNPPAATGSSHLEFFTVSNPPTAPTKVGSFLLQANPNGGNPYSAMIGQRVASSPNGTLAVSGVNCDNSASGLPEVQLYSSNATPASRTAVGTIPFDTLKATDVTGCNDFTSADYTYGNSVTINDIKWLSNTKLLVLLQTPNNTATQGIYIYDTSVAAFTSPGGFWCSGAAPSGPKKTSFTNLTTLAPHSAAYKP